MSSETKTPPLQASEVDNTKQSSHEIPSSNPSHYLQGTKLAAVTFSLCLGTFIVALDTTIVGVTIPKLTSVFQSLGDIAWYATAYLLPVTAFQPTYGALYKYFDLKLVYIVSILIFEIGSAVSAASSSSPMFIVGRAISGLGAAGLFQGGLSIIGYCVPLKKIPIYHGYIISVFGLSACLGPLIGGVFTDHVSWRWCFYINLPIGGIIVILILLFVKIDTSSEPPRKLPIRARLHHMDLPGTILFLGSVSCLFLALQWGGLTKPWNSHTIVGLFVGFGLTLILFCVIQWKRGDTALLPPRILSQRTVLFGSIYLFLFGLNLAVYNNYVPIYLQSVKSFSATVSGVGMIALDASRVVFIVAAGYIVTKYGKYIHLMFVGTAIMAVGSGLLLRLDRGTSKAEWVGFLLIVGAGAGFGGNHPFTAFPVSLRQEDVPIGNAIAVFALQFGTAIALSICQTLFINRVLSQLASDPRTQGITKDSIIAAEASGISQLAGSTETINVIRDAYRNGIRDAMIMALVAICISIFAIFGMDNLNLKDASKGSTDEKHVKEKPNEQVPPLTTD